MKDKLKLSYFPGKMAVKRPLKKAKFNYRKARYVVYRQTILDPVDHFWTFIGAIIGIGSIGFLQSYSSKFPNSDQVFLIGSFSASAVLI